MFSSADPSPAEVQLYLHQQIPLSAAMQAEVVDAGAGGVRLRAPLDANLNHRESAFGGSLQSLAMLASWTWMRLALADSEPNLQLVIQESHMRFILPVTSAFDAVCRPPASADWDHCKRSLERKRKGRVILEADIFQRGEQMAQFTGTFVAVRHEE